MSLALDVETARCLLNRRPQRSLVFLALIVVSCPSSSEYEGICDEERCQRRCEDIDAGRGICHNGVCQCLETPSCFTTSGCCVNAECDDGLECTDDRCDVSSGVCVHELDRSFCLVEGRCWRHFESGEEDACLECRPERDQRAWSDVCLREVVETDFQDFSDGELGSSAGALYITKAGALQVVTAGDVDGDGFHDLLTSNFEDGSTHRVHSSVFWGADSGFSVLDSFDFPTLGAVGAEVADIDDDGLLDMIVTSNYDDMSYVGEAALYWGNGGRFLSGDVTSLPTVGAAGVTTADLDGDGFLDVVISQHYSPDSALEGSLIYWGSELGLREENRTLLPTRGAMESSVADLDGDGALDVVFANCWDGERYVEESFIYWGSAEGFSEVRRTTLPSMGAYDVSIADLNVDGRLDIVLSNYCDNESYLIDSFIYWGTDSGYRPTARSALPTAGATASSIADLDRDGDLDVVFSNFFDGRSWETDSVVYWNESGTFSSDERRALPTLGARGNWVADLDGDGWLDIVFFNGRSDGAIVVDSFIYWGGADGFQQTLRTALPTVGAHMGRARDLGNLSDRTGRFSYRSSTIDIGEGRSLTTLDWDARLPLGDCGARFQLRSAARAEELSVAVWLGPTSGEDWYEAPRMRLNPASRAQRFYQYRVELVSESLRAAPRLDEVRLITD